MKIFVAMSGGVDSSVAAALLKEQGHDVTGVFMKNWSDSSFYKDTTMCPWVTDQEDARKVAALLEIPFYTFDFEAQYREKVVEYMVEGYKAGITPNPDVMCNKEIKFGIFFDKAMELGADMIATGHYARVQEAGGNYRLLAGIDGNKDQSYFLYLLTQTQLSRTLFPLGEYTKPQVRELARKYNLPTAEKKDSQGVCFVGELDVFEFLKSRIPVHKGKIITTTGKEVGEHQGIEFYTIGQRHGIGSPGGGTPYYVTGKDAEKNILFVGEGVEDKELYAKTLYAVQPHWISEEELKLPLGCQARIRYRQPLQKAIIESRITNHESEGNNPMIHNSKFIIRFAEPQRAVTPGQSIVFYDGDIVMGGAVISRAEIDKNTN